MSSILGDLLFYTATFFALYAVVKAAQFLYQISTSALWNLPGPDRAWRIKGNSANFHDTQVDYAEKKTWLQKYGHVLSFQGFMLKPMLLTDDVKAINHIITHTDIFQKPAPAIYNLSRVVGPGVLVVEGHEHKLQRRIMNPAFGPAQLRHMTEIFVDKSLQLNNILASLIAKEQDGTSTTDKKAEIRVDIFSWLNRTTLDIIGLAGFGYEFNSLAQSEPGELNTALATLLSSGTGLFSNLQALIPPLRIIPTPGSRRADRAQATMRRIGLELLAKAKAQAMSNEKDGEASHGRDLLSLLVKANMTADGLKLSDDAVLAQVPTFFVAGHETTSTAVTWTLFALSQAPKVQRKLRDELRAAAANNSNPTMDELNALPYLEKVVREVLRLHAPVVGTIRTAMEDTIIPVSKPYLDRYGVERSEIKVSKGDRVRVPIWLLHRSEEIWGPDASEFNPDRWENLPETTSQVPGIVNRLFTFLGGPRACIGYRFALVEMKALIFALVKDLDFELAVPSSDVLSHTAVVQHPVVVGSEKHQLPMIVRLAEP